MERKVSVCMATYNGELYVAQQIKSILSQLNDFDEIIVVDDCSSDNTVEIIHNFKDNRIKIFNNIINKGHVFSFGKSISLATNEIILMSDQDDIWIEGRVEKMVNALLYSKKKVLSSNSYFINEHEQSIDYPHDPLREVDSERHLKNIIGVFLGSKSYFGCAMAFTREIIPIILPIPEYVESHDLWIVFAANYIRSNVHFEEKTLYRRVHSNNASIVKRPVIQRYKSRIIFVKSLIELRRRVKQLNNRLMVW